MTLRRCVNCAARNCMQSEIMSTGLPLNMKAGIRLKPVGPENAEEVLAFNAEWDRAHG